MPTGQPNQPTSSSSVAVPIAVVVFALVITVVVVRVESVVKTLRKTDAIACAFIQADANTRRRQAGNAAKSTVAQRANVQRITRAVDVLRKTPRGRQRAATAAFLSYLEQERTVWKVTAANQGKNIELTRELASRAGLLSTQLSCSTDQKGATS